MLFPHLPRNLLNVHLPAFAKSVLELQLLCPCFFRARFLSQISLPILNALAVAILQVCFQTINQRV